MYTIFQQVILTFTKCMRRRRGWIMKGWRVWIDILYILYLILRFGDVGDGNWRKVTMGRLIVVCKSCLCCSVPCAQQSHLAGERGGINMIQTLTLCCSLQGQPQQRTGQWHGQRDVWREQSGGNLWRREEIAEWWSYWSDCEAVM